MKVLRPARIFKNFTTKICLAISFTLIPSLSHTVALASPPVLAISQLVEHPALEAVFAGIKETLNTAGLKEDTDYKLQFKNAQGNIGVNVQIAQQLVGSNPAILVAISTPSAQALAAASRASKTPLVFAAVSDPISAKLVKNLQAPGGHITGVSDAPPITEQIKLIRDLLPKAKTIGILMNPAEINSTKLVDKFKRLAEESGFIVKIAPITGSTEVINTARGLVGHVDLIYAPQDNTLVSAIDSLIRLQIEKRVPLITSDESLVAKGALAAIGTSYFKSGQQAGQIIIRILKGENPGDIPVAFPENPEVFINKATAESLKIFISDELKDSSHYID